MFCKNCYRWWMVRFGSLPMPPLPHQLSSSRPRNNGAQAPAVQTLMSLNQVAPGGHHSLNETMRLINIMRARSPYTSRASPSWAYIDDYLWYVTMWIHAYDWLDTQSDLKEAEDTMDLSARAAKLLASPI